MTEICWLALYVLLVLAFLGSELNRYEEFQAWIKEIDKQDEQKNKTK